MVIGPLITLIIFDRKKKWLMLDLTAIAAMQTIALLYGLQAIHGGRPAYVVFNIDRFDVVPRQDLNADSLARAPDGLGASHFSPRWVGALLPADPETRNAIMFSAVQGWADLPQLPEYFVPLDHVSNDMIKRLRPLEELRTLNEMTDTEWEALFVEYGQSPGTMGYLPMSANAKDGAVLVKRDTGEVLDMVMLTPKF